jgi:hypothetical protein
MKHLKLYEGFFDFFKKDKNKEIHLDDIKDCFIDLDMLDVKDDLINSDILDKSLFPYPFREDDLDKTYREFLDSLYPSDSSIELEENHIIFHIQFLENTEVEKIIIEGSEKVKKLLNCKVKIYRKKVLNRIEDSEKIYEHFVTILIKSNSKIII